MRYVADEGTPLPCGCPAWDALVVDGAGEVECVLAADPTAQTLVRHKVEVVNGTRLVGEEVSESRPFTMRCRNHSDAAVT